MLRADGIVSFQATRFRGLAGSWSLISDAMAQDADDVDFESTRAEKGLVQGLVSALQAHEGPMDQQALDDALGVTHVDGTIDDNSSNTG